MSVSAGNIIEFIFGVIILKGIIAHYIIDLINKGLKAWFGTTDRKKAIYEHYRHRALGEGHESKDVQLCGQNNCQLFA